VHNLKQSHRCRPSICVFILALRKRLQFLTIRSIYLATSSCQYFNLLWLLPYIPLSIPFSLLFWGVTLGFELGSSHLLDMCSFARSTLPDLCDGIFRDRVLRTICPGLVSNRSVLISAS
jgi:hypothetical protein